MLQRQPERQALVAGPVQDVVLGELQEPGQVRRGEDAVLDLVLDRGFEDRREEAVGQQVAGALRAAVVVKTKRRSSPRRRSSTQLTRNRARVSRTTRSPIPREPV